ncbi:24071_t:CDS:2, partial [Cetraspora pellucida]
MSEERRENNPHGPQDDSQNPKDEKLKDEKPKDNETKDNELKDESYDKILEQRAVASMSQAACTNVVQLGIVRFLLRMDEAGFSPSIVDIVEYVGLFYAMKELALRYSIFMTLISLAGAFSGIAVSILHNWFSMIFIIEGIPTLIAAIVVALYMTRDPADACFLTPEEHKFAIDRLRPEGGPTDVDRSTAKAQIKPAFTDLKVYVYLIIIQAQLMVGVPLAIGTIWMTFNSWASDRYQTRALNLIAAHLLSITCLIGLLVTDSKNP